ncbi:MAG: DMT family transporter [Inquilinaceae bacterium]
MSGRAVPFKPLTVPELALALFGTWFLWGSTFTAVKVLADSSPILLLSALRFGGAGLTLLAIARWRQSEPLSRSTLVSAGLSGVLLYGLGGGGFIVALTFVESGTVALISASVPFWVCLFHGLAGRPVGAVTLAGLVIGFTGVLTIVAVDWTALLSSPALAFAGLGALLQAIGIMVTRRLRLPSSVVVSACQMLAAAALFLAASLAVETPSVDLRPGVVLPFLYLVGPGTIVPVLCLNALINRATPFVATSYAFATPAVALALGHLLIGETLTPGSLLSFVLIALGLALVLRPAGPAAVPRNPAP